MNSYCGHHTLIWKHNMKRKRDIVHTPSQREKNPTQSVPCRAAKWWNGPCIFFSNYCRAFPTMKWGWNYYEISSILSYVAENTKFLVSPWGYGASVEKVWVTGENWWV